MSGSYDTEQRMVADRLREPEKFRETGDPSPEFRHPEPTAAWRILNQFRRAGVRASLPNVLEVIRASGHPRSGDLEQFVIGAADLAMHPEGLR